MDLSQSVIKWRGITLYGRAGLGRYTFSGLEGWEGTPDTRQESDARDNAHGMFDAPVWSDARYPMVTGQCGTPAERDVMLLELEASFNLSPKSLLPLTITHAGRTLTSMARLRRFKPTPVVWGAGFFGWAAEWVCPDPLRYGATLNPATGFPQMVGGLEYDLFTDGAGVDLGYLEYGADSATGRLVLVNTGTEDLWPVYSIAGPVPAQGFEIVSNLGGRVRFEDAVPLNSTLVIDSATGSAVIDGFADRGGSLTVRGWFPVPPGGSLEISFVPLGSFTTAQLTASLTPGSW